MGDKTGFRTYKKTGVPEAPFYCLFWSSGSSGNAAWPPAAFRQKGGVHADIAGIKANDRGSRGKEKSTNRKKSAGWRKKNRMEKDWL